MENPASGAKVLVVDDNAANRRLVEQYVVAEGHVPVLAESGEEALKLFARHAPDLVLLDVLMPGMDGYETCRRLRAMPDGPSTPIVFLTALDDHRSHLEAMEAGADDFLTKPLHRTELSLRVRSLIRIKRMSDDLRGSAEVVRSQRDALVDAQRQKEELTALVVHDLKNPLTAILMSADFLAHEPELSGDYHKIANEILAAADIMHRMVMNLLDISRSEEGMLVPQLTEVDLSALVSEVCSGMRRRIEDRRLSLSVKIEPLLMRGDRDLLRRLLENLLDNCVKYTPAGGELELRALQKRPGVAEIRLKDTGPGVPEPDRERVFQKHVRLERPANDPMRESSRGLGLAFCKLAAEAHGGRIWVEPNAPRGSVFCCEVPLIGVP